VKLTKREQEILLDRLELPDCLYQALFMDAEPDLPFGNLTEEQTYDACKKLEKMVESGELPESKDLSVEEKYLVLDSFSGGTILERSEEQARFEIEGYTENKHRGFIRVMNSLHKKLEKWSGESVEFP